MAHVTRDEATKHYESGYPDKMGGRVNKAYPSLGWAAIEQDDTMNDQYYEFANRQLRGTNANGAHSTFFDDGGAPAIQNGATIIVTEPLISPPFDCYSKVDKSKMPDWSPWKWMSKVIPNIDRLEIDIQFTKLDASMMFYYYGRGSANDRPPALIIQPNGVQANLLLYWAEVQVSTSIPRSLDLDLGSVMYKSIAKHIQIQGNPLELLIPLICMKILIIGYAKSISHGYNSKDWAILSQAT